MQVRHILAKYETRKETSNMQQTGDDQVHFPYEGKLSIKRYNIFCLHHYRNARRTIPDLSSNRSPPTSFMFDRRYKEITCMLQKGQKKSFLSRAVMHVIGYQFLRNSKIKVVKAQMILSSVLK
jgi:hypothetical protein